MNGRKLYTIPRMIALGVLIISIPGIPRYPSSVLITPFFSSNVCQANVRNRKFIHIGRMNMSTMKL